MTAFSNLGFETEGTGAGEAAGWTVTSLVTTQTIAAYGPTPLHPFETFEKGWSNDTYLFAFANSDLSQASYAGGLSAEGFESGWSNDDYQTVFGAPGHPTDQALYHPDAVLPQVRFAEDYEPVEGCSVTAIGATTDVGGFSDLRTLFGFPANAGGLASVQALLVGTKVLIVDPVNATNRGTFMITAVPNATTLTINNSNGVLASVSVVFWPELPPF